MNRMPLTPELYDQDQQVMAKNGQLRFSPLTIGRGVAATIIEPGGRELIDLSAGGSAAGLGYAHPAVTAAVTEAVHRMPGVGSLIAANPYSTRLAERLALLAPIASDTPAVYLGLAGSDANSAVVRSVRAARPGQTIVAFQDSYHGGIGPAQAVSGVWAGETAVPGTVLVPYGDADQVESAMASARVSAVLVEPVLCDGGVVMPPRGFLQQLRTLCDRAGALLIIDEVKVGLGRTGKLFAFEHDAVVPDIITLGKSLGGGLPISAAVGPRDLLDTDPAGSLLTLAGNPVCAAAALATLSVIERERLDVRAHTLGEVLEAELAELKASAAVPVEVRSRGLVGALELRTSEGEAATDLTKKVVFRAWQLGTVVIYVGPAGNVIELTPPLTISEEQLRAGILRLRQAIDDVSRGAVNDQDIAPFGGWE